MSKIFHRRPRREQQGAIADAKLEAYFVAPTLGGEVNVPIVRREPLGTEMNAIVNATNSPGLTSYDQCSIRAPADPYRIVARDQVELDTPRARQIGMHLIKEEDLAWDEALDRDE